MLLHDVPCPVCCCNCTVWPCADGGRLHLQPESDQSFSLPAASAVVLWHRDIRAVPGQSTPRQSTLLFHTKSLLISQMVLRHSRYPPILRTDTRTLAAPFKEQHTHRSSCQSVGNNYSPLAQDLKMVQLQQRPLAVTQAAALRILPI